MDHYDGEGSRDRSRGSRERGVAEPKDYGRLNSDPEWNSTRGRAGRSPGKHASRGFAFVICGGSVYVVVLCSFLALVVHSSHIIATFATSLAAVNKQNYYIASHEPC